MLLTRQPRETLFRLSRYARIGVCRGPGKEPSRVVMPAAREPPSSEDQISIPAVRSVCELRGELFERWLQLVILDARQEDSGGTGSLNVCASRQVEPSRLVYLD